MPVIFDSKDAVFFVGGNGTKAGSASPGGVTKEAWGNLDNPNLQLSDVMNLGGAAKGGVWSPAYFTVTNNGSGKLRITKVGEGLFSDCIAGLIADVNFTAVYSSGLYEVLAVDGANGDWVDIDGTYSADTTCAISVGGAFPGLQGASDDTDANSTTPHNVYILTNKAETFAAANSIDIDAGGGDLSSNTWKRIIGIDDDGVELAVDSWITINANGEACDCFNVEELDNVELRHIHAYNTSGNYAGFNYITVGISLGFLLNECKSTGHVYAVVVQGITIRNFFVVGGTYSASSRAFWIKGVINGSLHGVNAYSQGDYVFYSSSYGMQLQGCLFESDGTGSGVCVYGLHFSVIRNCVFYNVIHGISTTHSNSTLAEYNNIFVVSAKATGKAINRISGGIAYSDYGCLWAIDGAPAASDRWGGDGIPEHAIEEDPDFIDAANCNFRPRNPNVLRGGKPDIVDNVTQMGAIMQKYQFARRAKAANLGRLQIVR